MTLQLFGRATFARGWSNSGSSTVLRLRNPNSAKPGDQDVALLRSPDDVVTAMAAGFSAAAVIGDITLDLPSQNELPRVVSFAGSYSYLSDGDLVGFDPRSLRFRSLWRKQSRHNSLLVTERCNNYCLMCSQPPRDVDDRWLLQEIRQCLPLIEKNTKALTFTGGEPLSDWQDFVDILAQCRDQLPDTAIHVLTNGRGFSQPEIAEAWAQVKHPRLMAGIPVYGSVSHEHDYVVQARGAFDETALGILRLKDKGQRVEIRVVLHAITAPKIAITCRWLARNFPFVDHVALMGLENTGFAIANDSQLWIDPADYVSELEAGVEALSTSGVHVSIYNLPRCILPPALWPYAVKSISDWKNGFVEACSGCVEKESCAGIFTSGRPKPSRSIRPFLKPAN